MITTKTKAALLSVDEVRRLVDFCNWQREDLFDGLDLQAILDAYHAMGDWEGLDVWGQNDPNAQRVFDAIKRRALRRLMVAEDRVALKAAMAARVTP